jgi:hypothetical protein
LHRGAFVSDLMPPDGYLGDDPSTAAGVLAGQLALWIEEEEGVVPNEYVMWMYGVLVDRLDKLLTIQAP